MKKIYLFFCLLLVGSVVQAATNTWNIAGSGNWNTPGNWSLGTVPDATDDVVFANASNITVTLDFTTSTTVRSITIGNTANVTFTSGAASGAARTISLGAVSSCLVIPSGRALTLSGSVATAGVVLSIPTGGSTTISGSLALATFCSSGCTSQVNQLRAVDAGSVLVNGSITNNIGNGVPFGTYSTNNVIVFQSGSSFTAYATGSPFGSLSGDGTAQFLAGSTFNVFGGSGIGAANMNGRTYGKLVLGNGGTIAAYTNTSTTRTAFLDTLVVSGNNLVLQGSVLGAALDTTFYFGGIRLSTNSATATSSSLLLRANSATGAPNANFIIGSRVDIIAGSATTSVTPLFLTIGPNGVGTSTSFAHTNIIFTGANSAIQLTKQSGAGGYPDVRIGSPNGGTGGMVTNITVANGANLALGDSLTLRGGDAPTASYTTFTIKPTGKLTLTDAAVLKTNNNGYAIIESNATSTGTIGTVAGKLENGFVVQRYIPANAAWRTLGLPFNSVTYNGKIQAEQGGLTINLNYFASKTPTWAYYYNEAADDGKYGTTGGVNAGWTAITDATTGLDIRNGLLLYGSRNQAAFTLSDTGFINYGDQTIPLSKTVNGWNLIANPYPSNISFTSIVNNGSNAGILASNTVYRVNPLGNGAYSWTSYVSGSGTGGNGGSNVIENGAAFFVQAANASTNLIIKETDKTTDAVGSTTGGVTLMGANENYNSIRVNLKGANTFSDEVVFVWGRFSKATEAFDNDLDAYDLGASGTHDLSIVGNDDTKYSIFNGADLPKNAETRTYKLATKNLRLGTYRFEVSMPKELDRNNEAYIVDNFLATSVLVKEGLSHSFQVTADAASKAEGRFQLEIRKKQSVVSDVVAGASKTYLLGNPSRNNQIAIHFGEDAQQANWQLVDLSGRVVSTGVFNNVYEGDTRIAELKSVQSGTYLVRIFNGNEPSTVLKFVKL